MTHSRRSPRPLGFALDRARGQWSPQTLLGEVQSVWAQAVGVEIAAEATPTAERGGVVTVACAASVWAQELDLLAPTIVARLNLSLTLGRVTKIRCVTR
jgi:predicted nucleic acid-binding Zn ribbon protein